MLKVKSNNKSNIVILSTNEMFLNSNDRIRLASMKLQYNQFIFGRIKTNFITWIKFLQI